ncbi:MAG: phosphotransferase [Caldilineaceae bacterium]|nr:phosphotransferase [Caldilineaceae bacterium]
MNDPSNAPQIDPQLLAAVAARWPLDPAQLAQVSRAGNIVYRAALNGQTVYLRLTEPSFRTPVDNQAECDFLSYLNREGVAVALPVPSQRDREVEPIEVGDGIWSASVFAEAPGTWVKPGDALYTAAFVEQWGATLGRIHRAAHTFRPVAGWERGDWDEDFWLAQVDTLLPPDDDITRGELAQIAAALRSLPQTDATYGMTHGDFGPQNFRYDPAHGITAFDFGNCGYHWYMWDIAVALSLALWEDDAHKAWFRTHLLDGYAAVFPEGLELLDHLDWFLRLRMIVVYLSRLWWFGPQPDRAQQATLARIHANVRTPVRWERVAAPTWRG